MAWISKSANYVDDLKLLARSKHLKLIEIGVNFPFRYSEQIGPLSKLILQLELDVGLASQPHPASYDKRR
jgi:hypothetical protein